LQRMCIFCSNGAFIGSDGKTQAQTGLSAIGLRRPDTA